MNNEPENEIYEHYVYVLMDPTADDEVFYVGKGSGRRLDAHEKEAESWEPKEDEEESGNAKIDRINQITAAGAEVKKLMIGRFRTAEEAFAVEATLMHWVYGRENLTNSAAGHGHQNIRPKGDHDPERSGLEIKRERSNTGEYTKSEIIDPYEKLKIEDQLNELRQRLLARGYVFETASLYKNNASILAMPIGEDLFAIMVEMSKQTCKIGVRLRLMGSEGDERCERFCKLLLDQSEQGGYSPNEIRGYEDGVRKKNTPRFFVPDRWNGKLIPPGDTDQIVDRIDWYVGVFGLELPRVN